MRYTSPHAEPSLCLSTARLAVFLYGEDVIAIHDHSAVISVSLGAAAANVGAGAICFDA